MRNRLDQGDTFLAKNRVVQNLGERVMEGKHKGEECLGADGGMRGDAIWEAVPCLVCRVPTECLRCWLLYWPH